MNSNEVSTLSSFLDMIGGPDEYKGAVLVAALLRTFKSSAQYCLIVDASTFDVKMRIDDKFELSATFRNTYLYLFE